MEIKKVAGFSEEEIKILTDAGQLSKAVLSQLTAEEIDRLAPEAVELLEAVRTIITSVLTANR